LPVIELDHKTITIGAGSPDLQEFLEWDRHFEIADNYLISVALIYMLRAGYNVRQYTFFNLMVALFLAHEVEEEDSELRLDLIRAAFGSRVVSRESFRLFMKKKEKLWLDTGYNVIVKKEESDSVMNRILRDNYVWRRRRCPQMIYSPRPNRRSAGFFSQSLAQGSASRSSNSG
jgi:hypothetical protein